MDGRAAIWALTNVEACVCMYCLSVHADATLCPKCIYIRYVSMYSLSVDVSL